MQEFNMPFSDKIASIAISFNVPNKKETVVIGSPEDLKRYFTSGILSEKADLLKQANVVVRNCAICHKLILSDRENVSEICGSERCRKEQHRLKTILVRKRIKPILFKTFMIPFRGIAPIFGENSGIIVPLVKNMIPNLKKSAPKP